MAGRDRRGPEVLIWVPVHACGTPSRPAPCLRSRPRDGSATWTSLILTTAGQLTLGHRSANQRPRVPARCQALAKAVATGASDPTPPPPPFREGRCLPQKAGDGTWSSRASDAVDSFADTTRFGATDDNDNRHLDAASRRRSVLLAAPFYTHGH